MHQKLAYVLSLPALSSSGVSLKGNNRLVNPGSVLVNIRKPLGLDFVVLGYKLLLVAFPHRLYFFYHLLPIFEVGLVVA